MHLSEAAEFAERQVAGVRDDPDGRLLSLRQLYDDAETRSWRLPFRRAATAFMQWQLNRGLLRPMTDPLPGSPWWRAVNEQLLRDGWEARALARGVGGAPSTVSVELCTRFIAEPTSANWYRAHNSSIVAGYLANRALARDESRTERFFMNLVLVRVLYAHALVSAPRLALGWLSPVAPVLGDPRLGMTGLFLSMSRILPDRYPLPDDVETYIDDEHGFGRFLDIGIIAPRVHQLYAWSATDLGQPELGALLSGDVPVYAWPAEDFAPWYPPPSRAARAVRQFVPPVRGAHRARW
ncbi:hypothetical protein ACFWU5_06820 [Nocardia sp. NPDC058640]|uniref:hypothetical protein n=1 Tax=Nocardia sp. NPDC058640 TaxID=3346571 RepID=UPI00364A07BE